MYPSTCKHAKTISEKEAINVKGTGEEYMLGLRGEEMGCIDAIIKL